MSNKKKCAIYARVSTDKQSTEMQIAKLKEFASRCGWSVYREFCDNGFSGKDFERPAFLEMMELARKRIFKENFYKTKTQLCFHWPRYRTTEG